MQGKATKVPDAGKEDKSKAMKQRELYMRPGLPSIGEEASQMLGLPLPPAYTEVLIPFRECEARHKPKTKGRHKKAGRDVAERST